MVEVIRAALEDASELIGIKIRAFEWDLKEYGFGPPGYDSIEDLNKAIERAFYYKVVYNGKIAGGCSVYKLDEGLYELGSLYVDPKLQNKGIGTETIEMIEKKFPEALKWTLETPYRSYRNQHLYEKMGYKKLDEYKPFDDKEFYLYKYEK